MANSFILSTPLLQTLLLVSVRLAGMFLLTPVLAMIAMPAIVRVFFTLTLALVLTVGLPDSHLETARDLGSLIAAALLELSLGIVMGVGVLIAFGAFSVGGGILDVQIGYGMAQVFDPVTRRQQAVLTTVWNQLALVVFVISNGHHALLRGFAYSMERFPVGRDWALTAPTAELARQVTGLFSLGFALVAPVVLCVLLVEFALGVLTRNLPQMQMFALAIPLKIVLGMSALMLWFVGAAGAMERIYASIFRAWEAVFQ